MRSRLALALLSLLVFVPTASAQVIDFETLPGGAATTDTQFISTEYSSFGVIFSLLDRNSGLVIGSPRIAKAGLPQTAFEGCFNGDTPRPGLGLGSSFLTDGTSLGVDGDLRIEYATAVSQASGSVLDIDCRTGGDTTCEQWTISAFDAGGALLGEVILDAPRGNPNPECLSPGAGPGDAQAFGWSFDLGEAVIRSIVLRYTGVATGVGLAFDNFSYESLPTAPSAQIVADADTSCVGEIFSLRAEVLGGLPPYTYRWEVELSPGVWSTAGSDPELWITTLTTQNYRLEVEDQLGQSSVSTVHTSTVLDSASSLCASNLIVSSFSNNRLVRYSYASHLGDVLVPSGSGSLNGASEIVCRGDGLLYASSQANDRVLRYEVETGNFVDIFVSQGSGGLNVPVGLTFGPDGHLYVASSVNNSVLRYDGTTGAFLDAFVPTGSGLSSPTDLTFGPDGNLYVCSRNNDKILRFDGSTGAFVDDFVAQGAGGLDAPRGLEFGPDGNLYVAEEVQNTISRFDGTTGVFIDVFVESSAAAIDRPNDLGFAADGNLYVPCFDNNRLFVFDGSTGELLRELPNDLLNGPAWVATGCEPRATAAPVSRPLPTSLSMRVAYDRGLGGSGTIHFRLGHDAEVTLEVFDARGRRVRRESPRVLANGTQIWGWDPSGLSRGVYFARLRAIGAGEMREAVAKLVVLR